LFTEVRERDLLTSYRESRAWGAQARNLRRESPGAGNAQKDDLLA